MPREQVPDNDRRLHRRHSLYNLARILSQRTVLDQKSVLQTLDDCIILLDNSIPSLDIRCGLRRHRLRIGQGKRIISRLLMTVAIGSKHLAQQQPEVVFDVSFGVHICIRRHRIELELLLQHLLNVLAETPPHLLFPSQLRRSIRPRIQGNDEKEVDVVMGNDQRVAVKQAVLKLP